MYRAFDGQILFELGALRGGAPSLERAVALDPESAHALYHLALVLERLGDERGVRSARSRRANALDPEHYPLPVRVDDDVLRARVAPRRSTNLPRSIREYVEDVPVLIEDFPYEELLDGRESVSPQILGLFIGVPRTEAALDRPGARRRPRDPVQEEPREDLPRRATS